MSASIKQKSILPKANINFHEVNEKLIALVERTGYIISQFNGQRVYRDPTNTANPKGCEVYVGNLPRDMFEDELVPLFEITGKIFEMRLMLEFSGKNRGFCFIKYFDKIAAQEIVQKLSGYNVRGKEIRVQMSVDNCRLFIGGLPLHITKIELKAEIKKLVDGLTEIIMYPSHEDSMKNRGYAFLEFNDHRAAAMARRQLSPGSFFMWNIPVMVDWADPIPEVNPQIMSKVTILYLRNINIELTTNVLWKILNCMIPFGKEITRVHKINDYAFVHFSSRHFAEKALRIIAGKIICGNEIEVSWARPKEFSKENRMISTPSHFCMSVPARMRSNISSLLKRELGKEEKRDPVDVIPKTIKNPFEIYSVFYN